MLWRPLKGAAETRRRSLRLFFFVLFSRIVVYLVLSSLLKSFTVLADDKHLQNMMLPPPCFTLGHGVLQAQFLTDQNMTLTDISLCLHASSSIDSLNKEQP